jgi:DNA-binding NarL/FixJ family response regulator
MTQLSTGDPNASASASVAVAVDDSRLADDIVERFGAAERDEMVIYDDARFLVDHPHLIRAGVTIISFTVIRNLARYHMDVLADFCQANRVVLLVRSHEFLDAVPYLEFADGVIFQDATMHRLQEILHLSEARYSILPSAAVMDIVTDRLRCDAIARLTPLELSILDHVRQAKTNRAIARSLGLTEANVKTKVRAILKSLKFQNRTEAAVFAARQQELIRSLIVRRTKEAPGSLTEEIDALSRDEPTRH